MNQLMLWPWKWGYHYLPVAWSLSYEVLFYLTFGIFVGAPKRWFVPLLAFWTAVVAIKALLLPPPPVTVMPNWLPVAPLVLEFLAGCWAAVAVRRTSAGAGVCVWAGVAGIVSGLALLQAWLGFDVAPLSAWRAVLLAPPIGLFLYGATVLERTGRLRPPGLLCRIGDASYSIYLTHTAVGVVVTGAFLRRGIWPVPAWAAVILAAGEVVIGYGCYLAIERPLLRLVQPPAGRRDRAPESENEQSAARAA
jgi:exopolysaccharide production protein ExoZ